jgi:hypothetical protein
VVERDLRNAEAHEEYRVDQDTLEIVYGERRMTLSELEEGAETLTGALASIEAAVACYGVDVGRVPKPRWLEGGEHPRLVELLLRTICAALGVNVSGAALQSSLLVVVLASDPAPTAHQARTVLFAARPLTPGVAKLEAYVGDHLVAAFDGATIDRWSGAPERERDMVLLEALYECVVRCGRDRDATLADALATSIRLVINVDDAAVRRAPSPRTRRRFATRLGLVAQFATRERAASVPELAGPVAQLRAARDAARTAARDPHSASRLTPALAAIEDWANGRPFDWYGPIASGQGQDPAQSE